MNIQMEAEPLGDMEPHQSFISPPHSAATTYSQQSRSFSVSLNSSLPFLFSPPLYRCMQCMQCGVTAAFLFLFLCLAPSHGPCIFPRGGIMRASSDGWPRASHCIGALWLIELAKWKMKCQQGHAAQRGLLVFVWVRNRDEHTWSTSWLFQVLALGNLPERLQSPNGRRWS